MLHNNCLLDDIEDYMDNNSDDDDDDHDAPPCVTAGDKRNEIMRNLL